MRRRKPGEPPTPVERFSTIRQYILSYLEGASLTAKELAQYLRIPEKDVYDHLEHLRRTLNKNNKHLAIDAARCEGCGFLFRKRDRLRKPGRCPVCRSTLIKPPFYSITVARQEREDD
jgi:transcriptional regulator